MINTIPPSDSDDPCDDWSGNDITTKTSKTQKKIKSANGKDHATNM